MIKQVYLWDNGTTMVYDEKGHQMTDLQGYHREVIPKIKEVLKDQQETAVWSVGNWRTGTTPLTPEEVTEIDTQPVELVVGKRAHALKPGEHLALEPISTDDPVLREVRLFLHESGEYSVFSPIPGSGYGEGLSKGDVDGAIDFALGIFGKAQRERDQARASADDAGGVGGARPEEGNQDGAPKA